MDEIDFLVFGCWNKGNATRNNDFSQVVESIKKNRHSSPSRIYVAGDNYYPLKDEKQKKMKYYNSKNLESGFKKLKELRLNQVRLIYY